MVLAGSGVWAAVDALPISGIPQLMSVRLKTMLRAASEACILLISVHSPRERRHESPFVLSGGKGGIERRASRYGAVDSGVSTFKREIRLVFTERRTRAIDPTRALTK
jgi:hypothetical protein